MRKDRKNKAVHFSLRSEGKCDYNLQSSKKLLQNKRQCGIIRHPLLVGQEVMGLHLKICLGRKAQWKNIVGNIFSGKISEMWKVIS